MNKSENIVRLRRHYDDALRPNQPVYCYDPDLTQAYGRPFVTEGLLIGFADGGDEVFVLLDGEPNAARRLKRYEVWPQHNKTGYSDFEQPRMTHGGGASVLYLKRD